MSPTDAAAGTDAVDAEELARPGDTEGVPDTEEAAELLCGEVTTTCPLEHPATNATSGRPHPRTTTRRIRSSSLGSLYSITITQTRPTRTPATGLKSAHHLAHDPQTGTANPHTP
ncbi:hypothetical protein ACIF6L_31550 [Kitasatospora sp. NPDC086009]|uniref:hypothetical protein n=1 Tax=unclassified Kitasatospora TaxID=2633591 RepID=UPI0037C95CC7